MLEPVHEDWTDNDNLQWQKSISAALQELVKIAYEYLPRGWLENPPAELQNLPGHNLDLESYFASWKERDTHSKHLLIASLATMTPNNIRAHGLLDKIWYLLIPDSCLAHIEVYLQDLKKHFINYHFLIPHSSHLTQPLDRGIFSSFKWVFKITQYNDT